MIERHVQTIFCDDIRHEVGGKLSFIGVYSGSLFVSAFPVTLPKLCLLVKIVAPASKPLRSATLRVLQDEEILQEIVLDEDQLASASELPEDLTDEEKMGRVLMAQFKLVFSPMQLDGPSILRVRVQTEDGELRGMALRVAQAQPPTEPVHDKSGL